MSSSTHIFDKTFYAIWVKIIKKFSSLYVFIRYWSKILKEYFDAMHLLPYWQNVMIMAQILTYILTLWLLWHWKRPKSLLAGFVIGYYYIIVIIMQCNGVFGQNLEHLMTQIKIHFICKIHPEGLQWRLDYKLPHQQGSAENSLFHQLWAFESFCTSWCYLSAHLKKGWPDRRIHSVSIQTY